MERRLRCWVGTAGAGLTGVLVGLPVGTAVANDLVLRGETVDRALVMVACSVGGLIGGSVTGLVQFCGDDD